MTLPEIAITEYPMVEVAVSTSAAGYVEFPIVDTIVLNGSAAPRPWWLSL
ncbi:hypothetical protein [Nocardia sp. NPDC051750]